MLTAENIDAREAEIKTAREQFVQQHNQVMAQKTALEQRVANIDGALELIALFRKDIEAAKVAPADENVAETAQKIAPDGDEHGAETEAPAPPPARRRRNGTAAPEARAD